MAAVTASVEVDAPAQACFDWWRQLTRLPDIMSDVKSVTATDDDTVTKWKVSGPLGSSFEWTARLTEDEAPNRLAWTTTGDEDNDIRTSGAVHFTDLGDDRTAVQISLDYQPPAGKLGEVAAALLDNPQRKVEQAAVEFKTIVENR